MIGFIVLTLKENGMPFLLNAEHIVTVSDCRADVAVRHNPDWQYTVVLTTTGIRIKVKDTAEEIIEMLQGLSE